MKNILILLLVICCCGCSHDIEKIKCGESHSTTVGKFTYIQYDGHEYLIWSTGGYQNGITHSPNCPCKNKQDYDSSGID